MSFVTKGNPDRVRTGNAQATAIRDLDAGTCGGRKLAQSAHDDCLWGPAWLGHVASATLDLSRSVDQGNADLDALVTDDRRGRDDYFRDHVLRLATERARGRRLIGSRLLRSGADSEVDHIASVQL